MTIIIKESKTHSMSCGQLQKFPVTSWPPTILSPRVSTQVNQHFLFSTRGNSLSKEDTLLDRFFLDKKPTIFDEKNVLPKHYVIPSKPHAAGHPTRIFWFAVKDRALQRYYFSISVDNQLLNQLTDRGKSSKPSSVSCKI